MCPFPALSRDVACRVSPLAPVCYQYLFRVPIPAGDETRHATSLQGCALSADHYHPLCFYPWSSVPSASSVCPFPALSRDVACRVSPLAPVCYQYLFRWPIPAGDETRHATSLQGCALSADHYHALFSSVAIRTIRVIRVPFPALSRCFYPWPSLPSASSVCPFPITKKGKSLCRDFPFLCVLSRAVSADDSFFFDSGFLACKTTQVVQLGAAYFTNLVHFDAVDSR